MTLHKLLLCFAFLSLTIDAFAQNSLASIEQLYQEAETLFYLDNQTNETNTKAFDTYHKYIETCEQEGISNFTIADAYLKSGVIKLIFQQYKEALDFYHLSLKTRNKLQPNEDSIYFKNYVYLGDLHYLLENFDSAEYYYDKAQIIASHWQDNIDEIERLYNSLGMMYLTLGNYKQAHNFFQKALLIAERKFPDDLEPIVYFKSNLALASSKANNYQEAIEEYNELLQYNFASYTLYNNLGWNLKQTGNFDSAIFYLKKAVKNPSLRVKAATLNNLGNTYLELNSVDSALLYFQEVFTTGHSELPSKNTDLAKAHMGIAHAREKQSKWQEALDHYQRAIIALTYDFEDTNVYHNPRQYNKVISLLHLFEVLQGKGHAFYQYYQQDQDTIRLLNSLACYEDAIHLAKHIQKSYDTDDAKLFFVEHIYPVFEEALATAYTLYELTKNDQYVNLALAIAESSKASVLSETLKDLEIKMAGVVNDSLINEEKRLKQKITSLRIKLMQSNDSIQSQAYHESLTDLEIALARLIKTLQKNEKYYQLKYQNDSLDLAAIQKQAVGHDALALEYVTGQKAIYIFLITENKVELKRVPLNPTFNEVLLQVQDHLYRYQAGQPYKMQRSTVLLHNFLIKPYEKEIQATNRLIIIPDGKLSYIPFEILSRENAPDRYLIQDYTFNYAYSATLLLDAIQHRNAKLSNTVLAMAPFAGKAQDNVRSNGFNWLAASREEVEKIGGSIYLEDKATKRLFLKVASSYGILHLATHASVNSENPLQSYIAFYPEQNESDAGYRLYTHELYNLELDSVKLVVLSACEAGNGQLVRGEGIMSLARAFAYAGCPNIVTTLWKAADKSAAEITTGMHHYLKAGYTKDEALRLAKLDYLNSDIHPILKAPYYWANFIFIGDPAPIYSSYTFVWYIIIGGIILIIAIWLIRKRMLYI